MALVEDGVLVPHDVGRPDFLPHKRAVTGYTLAVRHWRNGLRRTAE